MTESEAKTKWCPMARMAFESYQLGTGVALTAVNIIKLGAKPETRTSCIGSACMMWRTFQQNGKEGYCGLAGKP